MGTKHRQSSYLPIIYVPIRHHSTRVENTRQIFRKKQNKPNFKGHISVFCPQYSVFSPPSSVLLTWQCGFINMVSRKIKIILCGGDWCLVVPLVFKTSVGSRRSRVGSIPIRLRHFEYQRIVVSLSYLCRYNNGRAARSIEFSKAGYDDYQT